jgi:hypothetical protein
MYQPGDRGGLHCRHQALPVMVACKHTDGFDCPAAAAASSATGAGQLIQPTMLPVLLLLLLLLLLQLLCVRCIGRGAESTDWVVSQRPVLRAARHRYTELCVRPKHMP